MRTMISNRVLVVCTANMIRSPFVSELLRSRLAPAHRAALEVSSAGTAARAGEPAEGGVVDLGRTYGLSLDDHRTRRLDDGMLHTGLTVLCAERAHRRVVLDLRPDLVSSVFTVREFARAVEAVTDGGGAPSWPALVQAAAVARRTERAAREEDDDIVDPVGRPDAVWLEFERQATAAVSHILAAVQALPRVDADIPERGFVPTTRRQQREMQSAAATQPRAAWRS